MRIFWILLTVCWLVFVAGGTSTIPALGPLMDVHSGIWAHKHRELETQKVVGLDKPVTVTYDKYGVPHIFAESQHDLYLAQGFVTASERLFQMDITTRVTQGRLSELVGDKGKMFDEFFIRFGMRDSGAYTLQAYSADANSREVMDAYVLGVNRWIERLPELPPEYKLLRTQPEKIGPDRIIHMAKALTFNLSSRSFDVQMTDVLRKLGAQDMLDLFPEFLPEKYENYVYPGKMGKAHPRETADLFKFVSGLKSIPPLPLGNPGQGSNNWAVAPSHSASGTSLFANDTHLGLYLPNTWFENQLSCPEFNVYGVSLASVPGIVNGMNKDVAWGPTNGTTDVMDFYEVEFESDSSLYYVSADGRRKAISKKENIRLKDGSIEKIEVVRTHLGYVIHREGKLALVASWSGHHIKNELKAVRGIYTAKNVNECLASFADWNMPIQNWICADPKNIGWQHAGLAPVRKIGEGRVIMDGRLATIPVAERAPISPRLQSVNPRQGYLQTANQRILPPESPYYLGWDYEPGWRGMAISEILKQDKKLTAQDMMDLQNRSYEPEAKLILPYLIKGVGRDTLDDSKRKIVDKLAAWDFVIRANEIEGTVYKAWMAELKRQLFEDDLGVEIWRMNQFFDPRKRPPLKPLFPRDARVAWMLERIFADRNDSDAKWADERDTADVESIYRQIGNAFGVAWRDLESSLGKDPEKWLWKDWNRVQFAHVARLPGFETGILEADGSSDSVRGLSSRHGPVYKFVVETGEWPKAWIQVPGGNSGDPFDPSFEKFVPDWAAGKMREVEFYRDVDEARSKAVRTIQLLPEAG